jgi:hypothetical protein
MRPLGEAKALVGPVAGSLDRLIRRGNRVSQLERQLGAIAHGVVSLLPSAISGRENVNMLIVNILNNFVFAIAWVLGLLMTDG